MEKCQMCKEKRIIFSVGKKKLCGDCTTEYLKMLQKRN